MTELIKCKLGFKPKEWGEKGNEAYFYLFIFLLMKLFMGLSFIYILVANPYDTWDCFKSIANMFRFKHFSNFNY